jgi:biotin-[acetyl-CoA-carboxylase] ligase BirA-like protein
MQADRIKARLEGLVESEKIIVKEEVVSTMDEVKSFLPSNGNSEFVGVAVALFQSAGRGRQGRQWVSMKGQGVYLSALFDLKSKEQSKLGLLPLIMGLELKERLLQFTESIKLKWPNDLVIETENGLRKLGGLLLEASHNSESTLVTIGVGINLKKIGLKESISLEELGIQEALPEEIAFIILESALAAVKNLTSLRVSEFVERYNSSMVFFNQKISLLEAENGSIVGINKGIDTDGSLLVENSNGISKLYSGDVHQGTSSI